MQYALLLVGCLSPLLTLAALWQVKEWRIDRLREHLRAEGWFRQLFGLIRPCLLAGFGFFLLVDTTRTTLYLTATLTAFALLSLVQISFRRQRQPVWTQKAIALVSLALVMTTLSAWLLPTAALPVLVVAQPITLSAAWLLLLPEDRRRKRTILARATALRAQHPDLTVIGITGSVGKTTTKELLAHILADSQPLTTPEHVNTEMGVAQWLIAKLRLESQVSSLKSQLLIVEMGAYRQGEIKTLCSIAKPQIGIITFIGTQHIALFGSQEKLCQAKAELVQALPPDGLAILNGDSAACGNLQHSTPCPTVVVGTGGHADLEAFDIEERSDGIAFRADDTVFTVPLHGTHNVTNVLLAIAAAKHVGLTTTEIANRLKTFAPPSRTFIVKQERGVTVLDDTHNASPASFKAAITWAKGQPANQKILVTSGLIELGQAQDRIHGELGSLAANVFSRVIFTGKQGARHFARGYGKEIETLSKQTKPISPGSLLVCEGRMSEKVIATLLP